MVRNQNSITSTHPDDDCDECDFHEKHIASDSKTCMIGEISKTKAFFKSLCDNACRIIDSLRTRTLGILHKTKLIMILHAKSQNVNINNHDYHSISDNPERIAEIKNSQVIETINVNDYIGLFTFNIHDLNEFNLMLSDTSHYYLNNDKISLGTLFHYVSFYLYLNNRVTMRELIFTKIIKDLIDNRFFNDSYDDYHANMIGLLSYVNSIMNGYPFEFAIETMKIDSMNSMNDKILNPFMNDNENHCESEFAHDFKEFIRNMSEFMIMMKWIMQPCDENN